MKQTFTLIALLSGMAAAQAQVAFPTQNATWTQRHGQGEANPSFSLIGLKTNDVSIGAYTYHKLYQSFNDAVLDESEYIGGLREDAGKVWFYSLASAQERLLYDFNVAVGDTITDPNTGAKNGIVHSIDYVTVVGTPRRRINFRQPSSSAPWAQGAWVEGIGNTGLGGLLGSPMTQPTCDCGVNTVCFLNNSVQEYKNPSYSSIACETVVATRTISKAAAQATIYPNPVTGQSILQIPADGHYSTLTIYSITGSKIITANVNGVTEFTVNSANFARGLYTYRLMGDNGATTGKFVVE